MREGKPLVEVEKIVKQVLDGIEQVCFEHLPY